MLPKRIVAFGASTIYGRVDPVGGGFVTRLRFWHEGTGRSHAVFNLGIEGDKTPSMLERFVPEVSVRRPDLIIVNTGLNDTRHEGRPDAPSSTALTDFKKHLVQMITQSRALAPICFVGPYPIDDSKTTPIRGEQAYYYLKDAEKYSSATGEVCAGEKVGFIDLFAQWSKLDLAALLHSDGLHANSKGHELIFENVRDFITTL